MHTITEKERRIFARTLEFKPTVAISDPDLNLLRTLTSVHKHTSCIHINILRKRETERDTEYIKLCYLKGFKQ